MQFDKNWNELSSGEITVIHLDCDTAYTRDYRITSTVRRMEREARKAASNIYSEIYLPQMACLTILDQIGCSYRNRRMSRYSENGTEASGIKKAAYYFLGFGENDEATKTLYAFRNGLMHHASFISRTKGGRNYWFLLDDSIQGIVQVAHRDWDGTLSGQSEETCSLVNRTALLDGISAMLSELGNLRDAGDLEIAMPGGHEEIALRYLHRRSLEAIRAKESSYEEQCPTGNVRGACRLIR